jgi:adenylate kinase
MYWLVSGPTSLRKRVIIASIGQLSKVKAGSTVICPSSAISRNALLLLEQSRTSGSLSNSLPIVSFGEALAQKLKQALVLPEQESRDGLKTLPPEVVSRYTGLLLDEMIERQPIILNSHTVYKQGDNLVTNPVSEQRLKPSHYMFVAADPEDIASWRAGDMTRQRPAETAQQIELHQAIALGVVQAIADVMDSQLLVVHNTIDGTVGNTERIGDFLSTL